jgi:hypothetical protein
MVLGYRGGVAPMTSPKYRGCWGVWRSTGDGTMRQRGHRLGRGGPANDEQGYREGHRRR